MNAVNASNGKTADDTRGGFHEEGGQWGTTTSGTVSVAPAVPGPAHLAVVGGAHMDPAKSVDPNVKNNWQSLDGTYHVHPSGSIADANGTKSFFVQGPSGRDIKQARGGINIVVGASDKKVYFYNSNGAIGKPMKLKDFMGR